MLFSGPSAVGKTTVAKALIERSGYAKISTSGYLRGLAAEQQLEPTKAVLQQIGDGLDVKTDFLWVLDEVARPALAANLSIKKWLLDSVRKPEQISLFRAAFPGEVVHVHLQAPEEFLQDNYARRLATDPQHADDTPYQVAIAHANEILSRALGGIADLRVEVTRLQPNEIAGLIANMESKT